MTAAEFNNTPQTYQSGRHLVAGRYRMDSRIGSGRLGDVFSAVDENYGALGVEQQVAIQIVPEIVVRNNSLYNKINAGYDALRRAAHPNIVNYRQFGRDGKFAYLVMDLLDGASLRLLLDEAGTLPLDEAIPVIRGIGEALRFLHAKSLVHGNLTAGNIVVTDELEVRLLDVVPLGTSEAIFRGAAMSEPSSRAAAGDDVFALACLAYEMLAGRQPFNHSSAAEARLAGLQPDRIESLTDGQWDALRRALSFDRKERTASVADFMRDFGIRGTERLRQADEQPVDKAVVATPPEDAKPPAARAPAGEPPLSAVDPDPFYEPVRSNTQPSRGEPGSLRAVFLFTLLAGLLAWTFYGQPEERIVEMLGYADAKLNLGLTKRGGKFSTAPIMATEPPVSQVAETPVVAGHEATAAEPLALPDAEGVTITEDIVEVPPPPPEQPVQAAQSVTGEMVLDPATATESTIDEAVTEQAAVDATMIDNAVTEEKVVPLPEEPVPAAPAAEPVVTVAEHDGAARIRMPQNGDAATPLIWWTSEHTAVSNGDFIPVRQQFVDPESGDESRILHVSLVNDGLPEPRESFFVNFGIHDNEQGRIERIYTVRVDIIDDDSR